MVTMTVDTSIEPPFDSFNVDDTLGHFNFTLNSSFWTPSDQTPDGFTLSDDYLFTGSGLTYDINGFPAAGTLTSVKLGDISISGFSLTVDQWNAMEGNFTALFLAGNDVIAGGKFNDRLTAYAGDDQITGGKGIDYMAGGTGRDVFDFNAVGEIGKLRDHRDIIGDFTPHQDKIDLSTIDANGHAPGDRFSFLAAKGADFTHKAGQLHWFQSSQGGTIVEGDVNGDGRADFAIELSGHKALSAGDFIL